jgi:hypothetical protein
VLGVFRGIRLGLGLLCGLMLLLGGRPVPASSLCRLLFGRCSGRVGVGLAMFIVRYFVAFSVSVFLCLAGR